MVRKYKKEDYKKGEGDLNLKVAERQLIIKASVKFKDNLPKMAKALKITVKILEIKLEQHNIKLENNDK